MIIRRIPNATDANKDSLTATTNPDQDNNKGNIIEKFIRTATETVKRFIEKTLKITGVNDKWITNHKEDLLNTNFNAREVIAASYTNLDFQKVKTEIDSAMGKINGINAASVPNQLNKVGIDAERYFFQQIPAQVGGFEEFKNRIIFYYTFGNVDKGVSKLYRGDELRTFVTNVIQFCENYRGSMNRLKNDLNNLIQAAAKKQEEIIKERRNAKKNGAESKVEDSNVITSIVRTYITSINTVFEKKYYDWMTALKKISPPKPREKANNEPITKNNKEEINQE